MNTNIDIEVVASEMLSAMKGTFSKNWSKVESVAVQFMQNRKSRLELLAELYLSGDITQQKFESRLEDEKTILAAELEALKVVSKALTQKAINAAFQVIINAIKRLFSILI